MASFQSGLPVCSLQYQLKQYCWDSLDRAFLHRDDWPQLDVAALSKELTEFGLVRWLVWVLAQGPILHHCNHLTQDGVCQLGLLPVFGSHTGNMWTFLY